MFPALRRLLAPAVALAAIVLLASGCVSTRYKAARRDTPPAQLLNLPLAASPVEVQLNSVITFNGAGSWKRDAYWDEFVVSLRNPGTEPLVVTGIVLEDFQGGVHPPGDEPWALERASKTAEQKWRDAGVAFVRYTAPVVIITAAGSAAVLGAGIYTGAAASAASATMIALPVYYLGVVMINAHNRSAMEAEFNRRRLPVPLRLAPGEARTGSLFFIMSPHPRALHLAGPAGDQAVPLTALSWLHVDSARSAPAKPAQP